MVVGGGGKGCFHIPQQHHDSLPGEERGKSGEQSTSMSAKIDGEGPGEEKGCWPSFYHPHAHAHPALTLCVAREAYCPKGVSVCLCIGLACSKVEPEPAASCRWWRRRRWSPHPLSVPLAENTRKHMAILLCNTHVRTLRWYTPDMVW